MNKDHLQKIIDLRHELHSHPELSMKEHWTKKHLMDFLKENTSLDLLDCGLWFYAIYHATSYDGGAESVWENQQDAIAFRGEFDAIPVEDAIDTDYRSCTPGVGHKCGHDGHASALAGLALTVDLLKPDRDVYFIFQPGEETGEGGVICADLIKKADIGEIYACHNMSGYPFGSVVVRKGTMWCASKGLKIHFTGLPSHASLPEKGHNPALSIATLIQYLSEILAHNAYTAMVLGTVVGVRVGAGDFGVSPGDGELSITLRGENEQEMLDLEQKLKEKARSLASQDQLTVRFSESDIFPESRNDSSCVDKLMSSASRSKIPVIIADKPVRSSEDFGYYTKQCPGAIFLMGNGEDYPSIHTPEFDYRDDLLERVVDLLYSLI